MDWGESHPGLLVVIVSLLYLTGALLCARARDIWYDEVFTYYIARPAYGTAWRALLQGGDMQPPPFYWVSHLSLSFFGDRVVALRLPAVAGFWLMSVCLFVMVARRCGSWYGLVAMLFPLTTAAFYYASEARSYGLELGFCALALVSWQAAAEQRRRPWSVAGLALGVALAVASHYYAVLLLIPLGVGELVRTWQRRRIDGAVWLALGSAALPLLVFWPVIQAGRSYSGTFWTVLTWSSVSGYLSFLLGASMPPILVGIAVLAALALIRAVRPPSPASTVPAFPLHETVAVVGTLLIPAFGFLLALFITKAYHARYVFPALIGVSILYASFAYTVGRGRKTIALALAGLLLVAYGLQLQGLLNDYRDARNDRKWIPQLIANAGHLDLPVVLATADQWTVQSFYFPDLRNRFVYLSDLTAPMRWSKSNALDRSLAAVHTLLPGHFEPLTPYLTTHRRFLIFTNNIWNSWLLPELLRLGWRIELINRHEEKSIYLAEAPGR